MPRLVVACALVCVQASCLSTKTVECGDGTICPEGTLCDVINKTCVQPGGIVIPDGLLVLDDVHCGSTASASLTLGNFGDEPISFSARSTHEMITVTPEVGTIAAGENFDVEVMADARSDSLPIGMIESAIYFTTDQEVTPRIVQVMISGSIVRTNGDILDFGVNPVDESPEPRTLTLFNDGNQAVSVTLTEPRSPFSISNPGPFEIEPGGEQSVDVSFEATTVNVASDEIALTFDGPLCQSPPTRVELGGEVSGAGFLGDTTVLDFGTSSCGADGEERTITLTSRLPEDQTVTVVLGGNNPSSFATATTLSLPAGESVPLDVLRNSIPVPQSTGGLNARLNMTLDNSPETFEVELRHMISAPSISVSPSNVDFGTIPPNAISEQVIEVTNNGNAPALVNIEPKTIPLANGGSLQFDPRSFNLDIGASTQVKVVAATQSGGYGVSNAMFAIDSAGQCASPRAVNVSLVVRDDRNPGDLDPKQL